MKAKRRLDIASEALLLILLLGTPLAFGSVEVWATETMKAGILLFVALRLARRRVDRSEPGSASASDTGSLLIPSTFFMALVLLQAAPLPPAVIGAISPRAYSLYGHCLPGFPGRQDLSGIESALIGDSSAPPLSLAGPEVHSPPPRYWRSLSIYPEGTLSGFFLLLDYLLLLFAVAEYARDEWRRVRLLVAVAAIGFAIAGFALVQQLSWNGKVFWLREAPPRTHPFGPFINPNHFAGYMELALPVAVALLLTIWQLRREGPQRESVPRIAEFGGISFPRMDTERPSAFSGWTEAVVPKTAFAVGAVAVVILAILASGSRGGLIATVLTFALFSGLLVPPGLRRRAIVVASVAVVFTLLAMILAALGISPLAGPLNRLAEVGGEPSYSSRWLAWREIVRLCKDFPLVGSGFGTFRQAFQSYYPPGVKTIWMQAHNDYLQLVSETGILGGLIAIWALVVFTRHAFLPALAFTPSRELRLGPALALVSIGLHSFVDFNLQIPSNAMLTVVLAGVLLAFVPPGQSSRARGSRRLAILGVAVAALSIAGVLFSVRRAAADLALGEGERLIGMIKLPQAAAAFERAHSWEPGRSDIAQRLGETLEEISEDIAGEPSGASTTQEQAMMRRNESLAALDAAISAYLAAIDTEPGASAAWGGLSSCYAGVALAERRRRGPDPELFSAGGDPKPLSADRIALATMDRALSLEPSGFALHDQKAALLLDLNQVREAVAEYSRSAELMPRYYEHAWLQADQLPDEVARGIQRGLEASLTTNREVLPQDGLRSLAEMASIRGETEASEEYFERALRLKLDKQTSLILRGELGQLQHRLGKDDLALASFTAAIAEPTIAAWARRDRSAIYASRGQKEEAFSDLRQAVALRPDDASLRMDLARIAQETARPDLAEESLESAAKLAPGNPEPLLRLMALYQDRGDLPRASKAAGQLVKAWPQVTRYRDLLAGLQPDYEPAP